jgi:hypothetical protein
MKIAWGAGVAVVDCCQAGKGKEQNALHGPFSLEKVTAIWNVAGKMVGT